MADEKPQRAGVRDPSVPTDPSEPHATQEELSEKVPQTELPELCDINDDGKSNVCSVIFDIASFY
jgi:hypothetical protein